MIQIHISFNLFKWIYLKSKSIFLDFKSNPFNWIWIRYIFGLSKLDFGLDFDLARSRLSQDNPGPGWAKSAQVHIKPSRPSPSQIESVWAKVDKVVLDQSRAESTMGQVELSGRYWVDPSCPEPISSHVGPGQCLLKSVHAHVELSLSGSIWSWAGPSRCQGRPGPGQCRVERAKADIESSGPGKMSRRVGLNRCRVVRAWVVIECPGPSRCRVDQVDGDFKLTGSMLSRVGPRRSTSKLSRIRPSSSQVRLCPYQKGFNVFDKVDLI